jgi:hypothetical protein
MSPSATLPRVCLCGAISGIITDDKVVCLSCREKRANVAPATSKFFSNVVQLFGEPIEPTIFRSAHAIEKIKQQDEYLKRRRTPTGKSWFDVITDTINDASGAEQTHELTEIED